MISLLLLISGDVNPNPGPNVSLDTSASSSCSDLPGMSVLRDHLNIVHLNIQSMYPKRDILEVEMQYYDIVVLTETWLSPNKKTEDIMIPNFDATYRKDRNDRPGGGVAIYIKSGISSHKLTNLIYGDLEGLCVEINIRNHKFLLCGIYRPLTQGLNYGLRYLYLIPQPLSVPKLLFGIPEATTVENNFIFKQVQLYILATKRFAMPSS